jgi:hypothetical protein
VGLYAGLVGESKKRQKKKGQRMRETEGGFRNEWKQPKRQDLSFHTHMQDSLASKLGSLGCTQGS